MEVSETTNIISTMELAELLQALPHRYPFLMIDRIIECNRDLSGIGIKNVTANEPQFQGHFPSFPVMPGVLMVEGMAQTGGALCVRETGLVGKPKQVFFMTIDKVKFRKIVIPGDRIEYHMTRIARRKDMWWYQGIAKVDGQVVCEAQVSAILKPLGEDNA